MSNKKNRVNSQILGVFIVMTRMRRISSVKRRKLLRKNYAQREVIKKIAMKVTTQKTLPKKR